MRLSIIVAMAANGVIGRDNRLPWRLPADLKRFKRLTLGHHLLMGRKTFESIGRPLPGRISVLITRDRSFEPPSGVLLAHSVEQAIRLARKAGEREAFVGGGAEIYRQTLDRADRIHLTLIHAEISGDTRFPDHDRSVWREVERDDHEADEKNPYRFSFIVYDRKTASTGPPGAVSREG